MDISTLQKANELNKKIKDLETAFDCFEWDKQYGGGSKNPRIVIEFDDCDGRSKHLLPMTLNENFISVLKAEIANELTKSKMMFNSL
jgi:hypothetical protein